MSLIFTSNTQDDYKTESEDGGSAILNSHIGIEKPADYHNHLTSPLEVKPNSQISVQSVKLSRKQLNEITDTKHLLYYFGDPLGTTKSLDDTTSRPTLVTLSRGTYDEGEFATEIQKQLNQSCVSPAVFNNFTVNSSVVADVFKGYTISASQRGTGFTNKSASLTIALADTFTAIGAGSTSTGFSTTGASFTRTVASGDLTDDLCCGIYTTFPLANGSNASFVCDFQSATFVEGGKTLNASWTIGLTRPTIQLSADPDILYDHGNQPDGFIPTDVAPQFYDYVAIYDTEGGTATDGFLKVYQSAFRKDASGQPIASSYKLHEIPYYGGAGQRASAIVNGSMNVASGYKAVEFKWVGDEMRFSMVKLDDSRELLISSTLNATAPRVFKPVNDFTSALYPKLSTSASGSTLFITGLDSFSTGSSSYLYPDITGDNASLEGGTYDVGNSVYGNYVSYTPLMKTHARTGQRPLWGERGVGFRDFPDYAYGQMMPIDPASTETISFLGQNASGGVAFEHLLVLEDTTPPDTESQIIGNYYSSMCDVSRELGFPSVSVLDQSYGVVTNLDKITWDSTSVPVVLVNSAFVRVSNLNHRTYNSCKNSISKMLYHIPRFTNDGRQFGDLFWEVAEKTYVDLNNTESFMLNQLQVQIVDKNERVVEDLTGDTIVVFHVKQK